MLVATYQKSTEPPTLDGKTLAIITTYLKDANINRGLKLK